MKSFGYLRNCGQKAAVHAARSTNCLTRNIPGSRSAAAHFSSAAARLRAALRLTLRRAVLPGALRATFKTQHFAGRERRPRRMELTQKQSQKLSMTAAMLQSLELLQLPVCELASRLQDAALFQPLLEDRAARSWDARSRGTHRAARSLPLGQFTQQRRRRQFFGKSCRCAYRNIS